MEQEKAPGVNEPEACSQTKKGKERPAAMPFNTHCSCNIWKTMQVSKHRSFRSAGQDGGQRPPQTELMFRYICKRNLYLSLCRKAHYSQPSYAITRSRAYHQNSTRGPAGYRTYSTPF